MSRLHSLDPLRNHNRHDPRAWAKAILRGSIPTRRKGEFNGSWDGIFCYTIKLEVTDGRGSMLYSFDDYVDSGGGHLSCTPVPTLAAQLTRRLYPRRPAADDIEVTLEQFVRLRGVFQENYVEQPPATKTVKIPTELAHGLWRWLLNL